MPYVIPAKVPNGVHPNLLALVWMLGKWQGSGHGVTPTNGRIDFGQQIEFSSNGSPYLYYISQLYSLDSAGQPREPLSMESGFIFPHLDATVDVVASTSGGLAELWYGKITGPKIELRTDAVVRMKSATTQFTAGQRLIGQVDGKLMWATDRATETNPLSPHLWGTLEKVS